MTEHTDPITHQEIAFAHLVLSGTMTDRRAAKAVGLNPDNAGHTKSKPRVRDYMQQRVEPDTEEPHAFNVGRDQVLTRLWEIANLDPERTRNSMTAQVKAISMIVAIEGLIPDRRAAQKQPVPPPDHANFYRAAWNRKQQGEENANPEPFPAPAETQEEAPSPELQSHAGEPEDQPAPAAAPVDVPQTPPVQAISAVPRVPTADHVAPDTTVRFSLDNRFRRAAKR
jgi:hypothetical protein